LIISMIIYAFATRYETERYTRIDTWTGKIEVLEFVD